jgi:hypothetical protein
MATAFQIAVDCRDPHAQARFWAAAMDLEVEDHEPLIRRMLDEGFATEDMVTELDGRLVWPDAAACSSADRATRLLFQTVPEPKQGKNRVHLDLQVGADAKDAEVARLEALGATRLWEGQQGPHTWVTMADPEGNEFCVG